MHFARWFVLLFGFVWFGLFCCCFYYGSFCLFVFPTERGKENVKENIPKKPPKLYSGNGIGSLKMLEVVEINMQENLKEKKIKHKSIL